MNRRLLIGLFAALCLSITACTTDDGGVTVAGNATPRSTPVVGDVIHGANLAKEEVEGLPSEVLRSVSPTESNGVVEARDTREKAEDRRVNRRNEVGLPLSAEDRIRLRKEERRAAPDPSAPVQR